MIAKDLFDICSFDSVFKILSLRFEDMKEQEQEQMKTNYFRLCRDLTLRTPTSSDFLLLSTPYLDDGEEFHSVSLFLKKEIEEKKEEMEKLEEIDIKKDYSTEEIRSFLSLLPQSYSFSFSPWSKILGCEVSEENVKEYGAENILADLLYEITFFGFSEEEMEEEKEKLEEAVSEVKEMIRKEKEEGKESSSRDIESLFKEFHLLDERTEEEKEEEKKRTNKEMVWNIKKEYEVLKKV